MSGERESASGTADHYQVTVWARDKSCRFPGCERKRFVDAHHVVHWSAGGETCLGNLLLLCSTHHALVHEGGFTIEKDYRDHWFFRRPDGRTVPECGYLPEDVTDPDADTPSEYFAPDPSAEGGAVREPAVIAYRRAAVSASAIPTLRGGVHG